jgi:hypothetical protein
MVAVHNFHNHTPSGSVNASMYGKPDGRAQAQNFVISD